MPLDLQPGFTQHTPTHTARRCPPTNHQFIFSRILKKTSRGKLKEKMNDHPSNSNNNGGAGYEIEYLTSEQSPPPTLPSGKSYDVFISFRGVDTRTRFTDHLYRRLVSAGIRVFRDNEELHVGESIGPELYRAIKGSKISIPIISPRYASSKWCLNELVQMLKCRKTIGQRLLPVFYDVTPSDVRHQTGSFEWAFELHNKKYGSDSDLVQEWKNALTEVSSLKGWESSKVANGHEGELIKIICNHVNKLRRKHLHVADFPVMLEDHVDRVASELVSQPMVGLWGIGGIGKTTIAKAVFNLKADSFDGSCFLANVRATRRDDLVQLQKNLLCDVLDYANFHFHYVDDGVNIIRERLGQKKILVVVDNVDNLDQLMKLVGDYRWFGPGSRVIITTRDKHLLIAHGVKFIHEVTGLDDSHAHKLFVWNAFRENCPSEVFESCIHWLVDYAKGLPLALVVLGSFLRGRSLLSWQSAIEKLEKIPNEDINEVLKISYDGLEFDEKAIFLDLACFFRGRDVVYVMEALSACGFKARIGLEILFERSLVSMHYEKLEMHDLIQLMGREIVRQESEGDPGKRSRLWSLEDINDVFINDSGTETVKAMVMDMPESGELFVSAGTFNKMRRLKLLVLQNAQYIEDPMRFFNELRFLEWPKMPLSVLEFNCGPKKLVHINMFGSKFTQLGEGFKNFESLKSVDFRNCEGLVKIPDFSTIPNLEVLLLSGCKSLVEVHESIGSLSKLVTLDLHSCSNLQEFPSVLHLIKLRNFVLTDCFCLTMFPHIAENIEGIRELHVEKAGIRGLPLSIKRLVSLRAIYLDGCEELLRIPDLPLSIKEIHARGCKSLKSVHLSGLSQEFSMLKHIDFSNCHKMTLFANYPSSKVLKEKSCVNIYLPGSEISRWFDHQNEGKALSFPVTVSEFSKCEAIALCAIFGLNESSHEADVEMMRATVYTIFVYVNENCFICKKSLLLPIESDHMLLFFDAQGLLRNRWMVHEHQNESIDFVVSIQVHDASRKVVLKKVGVRLVDERDCDDPEFSLETSTIQAESSKKKPKLFQDHHHSHADCLSEFA